MVWDESHNFSLIDHKPVAPNTAPHGAFMNGSGAIIFPYIKNDPHLTMMSFTCQEINQKTEKKNDQNRTYTGFVQIPRKKSIAFP